MHALRVRGSATPPFVLATNYMARTVHRVEGARKAHFHYRAAGSTKAMLRKTALWLGFGVQ